jgi:hypothetical protein
MATLVEMAAEDDRIMFVTGDLGGSLAGRHLEFEPRLTEARWLTARFPVHAMIDLSDGLAGDLRHLLHASQVGADLLASAIPISRAAKERARSRARESAGAFSRRLCSNQPALPQARIEQFMNWFNRMRRNRAWSRGAPPRQ